MSMISYNCDICQKQESIQQGEKVPECCGKPMTARLGNCTHPFSAESARLDSADEPCDDGVGKSS